MHLFPIFPWILKIIIITTEHISTSLKYSDANNYEVIEIVQNVGFLIITIICIN